MKNILRGGDSGFLVGGCGAKDGYFASWKEVFDGFVHVVCTFHGDEANSIGNIGAGRAGDQNDMMSVLRGGGGEGIFHFPRGSDWLDIERGRALLVRDPGGDKKFHVYWKNKDYSFILM